MLFPDTRWPPRVMWQLIEEYGQEESKDFHVLGIMIISAVQLGWQKAVRPAQRSAGPQGP